jgi:hypothetical protein
MKKCVKCNIEKELNQFNKNKRAKDNYSYSCKDCKKLYYEKNKEIISENYKKYYEENKEILIERAKKYNKENKLKVTERKKTYYQDNKENVIKINKQYYQDNKEKLKKLKKIYSENNKENIKQYRIINKEKLKNYNKEYYLKRTNTDLFFKFKCNVRSLIRNSFKRGINKYNKTTKTENILGCTIDEFRNYIYLQFKTGMSFENHGEWHLDHKVPIASAKTQEEVIKLNHYTNFQPLWAEDNLRKGSKVQ